MLLDVVEAEGEDLDEDLKEDLGPIIVLLYRTRCVFHCVLVVL